VSYGNHGHQLVGAVIQLFLAGITAGETGWSVRERPVKSLRKHQPEAMLVLMEDRDSGYFSCEVRRRFDAFAMMAFCSNSWLGVNPKAILVSRFGQQDLSKESHRCIACLRMIRHFNVLFT